MVVTVDVRVLVFVDDIGGAVVETGMVVVTWRFHGVCCATLKSDGRDTEDRQTKNQGMI